MDQKVEVAPFIHQDCESRVHRGFVGDVAWLDNLGAHGVRQRPEPALDRLALIGEGQLGALGGHRLGDAPGQGAAVGDPHYQAASAFHQ